MKLSTKTRYAVRAVLDLNNHYKNCPVSIKDIAARQKISERYLENIFHALRKADILISSKGKGGGFVLGRSLNDINLLEITEILDGPLNIVDCTDDNSTACFTKNCKSKSLWKKINLQMKDVLSQVALSDIENL
ncbi:MAG: Rrf2 family transcriptional regulator [Spirochaetes bacterium]|nr:Rrf2 family transcriptional regulator [Spirochaetota bacterium]